LNTGLTQALSDGTNTYIYGLGRIAQVNTGTEYFLGDALGSVRQLTNQGGAITYSRAYDPYGVVTSTSGTSETPYGYTNEYYGDSTQLTYLRSRYYSSGMGRFLTRDTWGGDYNRPLSLNRWNYVEGNPVNLLDPTGMKPGDSKYCLPLSGKDSQYCNNIVRGINPEQLMTAGDYIVFDQLDSCYTLPLQDVLPHYINQNTAIANGWWFHYLVDKAPGWWNNNGKDHAYFSDVIGFAIGAEMGPSFRDYEYGFLLARGFANKGWKEGMYRMLGGRQSATGRVNTAIYGSEKGGTYQICGKTNASPDCKPFSTVAAKFATVLNGINLQLTGGGITNNVIDLGHMVLWRSSWRAWDADAAYEWGNPTEYSKKFDKLMNALSSPAGPNDVQVLYHSYPTVGNPIVTFVVSKNQADYLCDMQSCVAP